MAVYLFLAITDPDKAINALNSSSYYFIEMIQIMPVIFLLTVSIDTLIPKSWILEHLGDNAGIKGSVLALVFGSVSAGPIYAAFPITKMLHKKGASTGNIVVILSAWAVIKVPMLANEAKFLGPTFMITRWILTVAAIFIMGWFMNKTVNIKTGNANDINDDMPVMVNGHYCIGCGMCAAKLPEAFIMASGTAITAKINNIDTYQPQMEFIANQCPAKAITLNLPKER